MSQVSWSPKQGGIESVGKLETVLLHQFGIRQDGAGGVIGHNSALAHDARSWTELQGIWEVVGDYEQGQIQDVQDFEQFSTAYRIQVRGRLVENSFSCPTESTGAFTSTTTSARTPPAKILVVELNMTESLGVDRGSGWEQLQDSPDFQPEH